MTRLRSIVAILGLLAATTAVSACNQGSVFNLEVGDCFNNQTSASEDGVTDVPIVDCADLHDNEVYADAEMEEDAYPGQTAVEDFGDDFCYTSFAEYVGKDYQESTLLFAYYYPSQESWSSGDRLITCYAFQENIQTTGTFKGSGM